MAMAATRQPMRMAVPAVFFLESAKPLTFVGSQALVFMEPIIKAFLTIPQYSRFARLMEDRQNVELLIQAVERLDRDQVDREKESFYWDQVRKEKAQLEEQLSAEVSQLKDLRSRQLLTDTQYRELKQTYGTIFEAGIGAEAILQILKNLNLDEMRTELIIETRSASGQRRRKASKQLQAVEAFRRSGNKPEWLVLTVLPVLPPELRPMVQLDGGRFATSDLNDL